MADPLSQLRQFHKNRKEIKEINGYIVFGDHGWPKKVNTNYQIYSSDEDKSKKEYYTLECLLYFLKNIEVAHHHYVKQAGAYNIPVVHRPDRKNLLDYLKGDSPTSASIDKNAPIPNSLRLPLSEILKKGEAQNATNDSKASTSQQPTLNTSGLSDRSGDNLAAQKAKKRPHDPEEEKQFREAFAARLNEPSSKKVATKMATESTEKASGETTEASAAISKFGFEKLAAMRAKLFAVKRTTIVELDPEVGKQGSGVTDPISKDAEMLIAIDSDHSKLIKSKEKIWRTRSSILQAQSKDFSKTVLPLANLLGKSDDPNRRLQGPMQGSMAHDMQSNNSYHQQQQNPHQNQQSIQKNAYNRYDQERFVKLDIGVEIDTKKSFVSGAANGLSAYNRQPQPAQRLPGQSHPPMTSNGQVRPEQLDPYARSNSSSSHPTPTRSKRQSTVPIIIIPATNTSLINMYNAGPILQDLTFVEGLPNKARESELLIQRKKPNGTHAAYKIIDNPLKLDGDDWNRVVAVFVQGPAWQFKGWPWGGSPVEIFSRIKGFHLKWDESKLDENVAKWNVHVLELSRNKRHLDKANLLKFWSSLDQFMAKCKSFLKF